MENWKIIDKTPLYEISNLGNIRNVKTKKILKVHKSRGYYKVKLFLNNRRIHESVHRLVAKAFLVIDKNKPQVNHKNGNKEDNRLENLEWCDHRYNIFHSKNISKNGTVISRKKILDLYSKNDNIELSDFVELLINSCN
jgi:Flp pilus assembly CpaF family ATPase